MAARSAILHAVDTERRGKLILVDCEDEDVEPEEEATSMQRFTVVRSPKSKEPLEGQKMVLPDLRIELRAEDGFFL